MRQGISPADRKRSATMRAQGKGWAEIARAVQHDRMVTARAAMRIAHGWTQNEAADEWNRRWPDDWKEAKTFSYWESWPDGGGGRKPSLAQLARLADMYECGLDDLLTDVDYATLETISDASVRGAATMDDVERRVFILGGASLVAAPSMAAGVLLAALDGSHTSVSVGQSEIDEILAATSLLNRADHEHGGGYARSLAVVQLRHAAGLLQARCPTALRPDLFSAVAHLADNCAFMTFDAAADQRADRTARVMWNGALECTEEIGDWHLQVAVLVNLSRQALWLAKPDEALALTERALSLSHHISPRERALVWSTRASVHAQRGDVPATVAAIKASDGHFGKAETSDDEPSWMYYYDGAEHSSSTGHALYDLVMSTGCGEYDEAVKRQTAAVDGFPAGEARSKALSGARLAILQMRHGDPGEAATTGQATLDVAGTIHSRRTHRYLALLAKAATPHSRRDRVGELLARLPVPA